jgi:integrase
MAMEQESASRSGFFEPAQYESVLRHLPREIQPIIVMAYITGWRVHDEILPLEWRQVDSQNGEIWLEAGTTKNGEARTFPMTDDLRTMLEAQHATCSS